MKIIIKTTNLKLTSDLEGYIRKKINSLEKFVKILHSENYFNDFLGKGKPKVEAWVEVGKISQHHEKGPIFVAECQIRLPKKSLRSVAKNEDLKQAITEVKDELQRELKQYKNKKRIKAISSIKRIKQ